jgi:O-antigen/teichoic acid export membrane protein
VLGRLGGAAPLGVFAMASDITTLPTTELVMPINRAVFPAYAGMANDRDALRGAYLAVLGMVALAITPAALGLIAVAPLAVPLLLGPAWSGVIPLVAPLALFGLSLSLQTNAMSVYWAVGRPRLGAITSGLMLLALAIPIIPMTRSMGSTGTALACVISGAVTVPATFWLLARLLDLGWRDFVSRLWRPAVAGLVMMLTVQAFVAGQFTGGWRPGPWVGLPLAIAIGGFVYALLIAGLWTLAGRPEGSEAFVLRRVSDTLRQRRARTEA